MNGFFKYRQNKTLSEYSACVAFNKATNGHTCKTMACYMEDEANKQLQSGGNKKSRKVMTASVQENKSKHIRGLK